MTKKDIELLNKLSILINETEKARDEAIQNKDNIEQSFCLGKINGLLWAKAYILNTED